ncbi:MAG TPA: hypothetical protein VGF45_07475 [Polyangia bacterium]
MTSSPTPRYRRLYGEIIAIVAGAILVALGSWYLMNVKCNGEAFFCENEEPTSYPSPSGRKKVVLFLRNCGATTPYVTNASVLDADVTLPDAEGNALSVRGAHVPSGAPDGGPPDIVVEWVSDESVRLIAAPGLLVLDRKDRVGNVRVQYIKRTQ